MRKKLGVYGCTGQQPDGSGMFRTCHGSWVCALVWLLVHGLSGGSKVYGSQLHVWGATTLIKGGWLGTIAHIYPSEMAQNFWTAIFAWITCFVATILISLVTKRTKTDEELVNTRANGIVIISPDVDMVTLSIDPAVDKGIPVA